MKRYAPAAILWILSMILLSACSSTSEEEALQRVTLEEVEVLEIDHGSTTLYVETADVEALEVRCSETAVPQGPLLIRKTIG